MYSRFVTAEPLRLHAFYLTIIIITVMSGNKPSFFNGGTSEIDELHKFLCATYRVLLDGRIRLQGFMGERLVDGTSLSLSDVANDMSKAFLGT